MKLCKRCGIGQAEDCFREYRQRNPKGGYYVYRRRVCMACESIEASTRSNKKKCWLNPNNKTKVKTYRRRRFFWYKAVRFNQQWETTHNLKKLSIFLWTLWHRQKGKCALSGVPMTRDTAWIDHILPRTRGGGHSLDNIRWTHKNANKLKSNLTDAEFKSLITNCYNTFCDKT